MISDTRPQMLRAPMNSRLAPSLPRIDSLAGLVAGTVVLFALCVVWVVGGHHDYIPCRSDCGETVLAQEQVAGYRLSGVKYGFIQYQTEPTGDLLYTHNVHIGAIVFVLLDAIGVRSFWAKQVVTLAAFGLGLLYVFRTAAYYSKSSLGGLIILILFCLDYEHVLSFGLNALRAWHWLALFGLAFHTRRLMVEARKRRTDYAAVVALAFVAFGIGYDFWLICSCVSGVILLLSRHEMSAGAGRLTRSAWVLGSLVLPFVIRQVQVVSVLGTRYWVTDFLYTVGTKVPGMSRLLRMPSLDAIDAFYEANHILRPPAFPASSLSSTLATLADMISYILIPGWGLPFCLVAVTVALFAIADVVLRGRTWYRARGVGAIVSGLNAEGWCLLIAALSIGIGCGLAILAPFSLHVYIKHGFPLLAAAILVPAGACLTLATESLVRTGSHGWRGGGIAAVVIAVLAGYNALIQINNARTASDVNLSWIRFLSQHKRATYALSYRPLLVDGEAIDWVRVGPEHAPDILERARRGQPLFDGFMRNSMRPRDYWIYQPADRDVEFDAPSPSCRRQDPLVAALAWIRERVHQRPGKSVSWAVPGRVARGSPVVLGGTVDAPRGLVDRVEVIDLGTAQEVPPEDTAWSVAPVSSSDTPIKEGIFNCWRGTFIAEVGIPIGASEGIQKISIRVVYRDGRRFEIGRIMFQIRRDAPQEDQSGVTFRKPDLGVDAVVRANPGLKIVGQSWTGNGYVIFDLRTRVDSASRPVGGRH